MYELKTSSTSSDLDWDKLKAFYYAAKVGNISHASSFRKQSQSSLSRSIAGLEKSLGYPLFTRSRNGVIPTRKGEELFEIVDNIFINLKKFTDRKYITADHKQKRKIRIASTHALAAYILNELILAYNKLNPDLLFEIIEVDEPIDIILHDVDIAIQPQFMRHQSAYDNWHVIQEPLFTLEQKLYASPLYLEQWGEPQTVNELIKHRFITCPNHESLSVDGILEVITKKAGVNHGCNIVFVSNSLECMFEAACQGKGIISAYNKMTILKNSALRNILPDITLKKCPQYFVYPVFLQEDKDILNIKTYLMNFIETP
jgi:DNA-binding transcriptional LysR family regulator